MDPICGTPKISTHNVSRQHKAKRHPIKAYHCGLSRCPSFSDKRTFERHLKTSNAHLSQDSPVYKCRCTLSSARWDKFHSHAVRCRPRVLESPQYACMCGQSFEKLGFLVAHYS